MVISNAGTTFDGVLGVYTGPSFALSPIACSAGQGAGKEVVTFMGTSNVTYSISMSGTNTNTSGTVSLQYSTLTPPLYSLLPVTQTDPSNATVTLSVATTGSPSITYQWQLNGTNIPGATSSSLTLGSAPNHHFLGPNQGDYSVIAMNAAGTNIFRFAPVFLNNPPQFANTVNASNLVFTQLMGMANSNYLFQTTTDIVNWITVSTNNSPSGVMILSFTNGGTNASLVLSGRVSSQAVK